jgi:CHASE2 domain-containing sensor protein
MMMTNLKTRVTMDAELLAIVLALVGGGFGGRTLLLGVLAGGVIAVADFWWLSSSVSGATDAPNTFAWMATAGVRLAGVAVAVAALFLTGWFHPVGLVIGLSVLPCALVARGLRLAREGT